LCGIASLEGDGGDTSVNDLLERQSLMADHELSEDGFRILDELFGSEDPSAPPTRGRRKYVLEYQDGEPVFRLAEMPSKPTPPRDEIDVALDQIFEEELGNDIVPQKLAKLFPGSPVIAIGPRV
jgi:hypothetical protein